MESVASELNRIVGIFWQQQAGMALRSRESAAGSGITPRSPAIVSAILRESLKLVDSAVVERFLSDCDNEAKLQIERLRSGTPRKSVVNPYGESVEKALVRALISLLESLKKTFKSKDTKSHDGPIESKALSLRTEIAHEFKKRRRAFEIQANSTANADRETTRIAVQLTAQRDTLQRVDAKLERGEAHEARPQKQLDSKELACAIASAMPVKSSEAPGQGGKADGGPKLQRCQWQAYYAKKYVETRKERECRPKEVWDWWRDKDNEFDPSGQDETTVKLLSHYVVPDNFATFKTHLSRANTALDDNRNKSRKGRAGRSVVKADEL